MRFSILATLLFLPACAAFRPYTLKPDAEWREVTTPRAVIVTGLDSAEAQRVAARIDRMLRVFLVATNHRAKILSKVHVVVPPSFDEFSYLRDDDRASSVYDRSFWPPRIVLARQSQYGFDTDWLVSWSLAQHVMNASFQRQPRWFQLGFTRHLAMSETEDDQPMVYVGRPREAEWQSLVLDARGSFTTMWDWELGAPTSKEVRWSSWIQASKWAYLAVSFLRIEHPQRFERFLDGLARGDEPRSVWDEAFAGLTNEQLDEQLETFIRARVRFLSVKAPLESEFPERVLSRAEMHATRASLVANRGSASEEARKKRRAVALGELALGRASDPWNLTVAKISLQLDDDVVTVAWARELVKNHPRSADAHHILAEALESDPDSVEERISVLERATYLDPTHEQVRLELGSAFAARSDWSNAEQHASAALQLSPNPASVILYAKVLAHTDRCAEADALLERALDFAGPHMTEAAVARYRATLDKSRAGCAATASDSN